MWDLIVSVPDHCLSFYFAAGAGRVGYIFYSFHLCSLSNVLSFGRRLNITELLLFRLLNPMVVVS